MQNQKKNREKKKIYFSGFIPKIKARYSWLLFFETIQKIEFSS